MTNYVLATSIFWAIFQCSGFWAEEPPSRLELGISKWLKTYPKTDDSWKDRKELPYTAVNSNASADPNLSQFVAGLVRFTTFRSSEWPGKGGNYLESLVIENTTLTPDLARQFEPIATEGLTISNCDISEHLGNEVAPMVTFQDDPRWPPHGGYCRYGVFKLYKFPSRD